MVSHHVLVMSHEVWSCRLAMVAIYSLAAPHLRVSCNCIGSCDDSAGNWPSWATELKFPHNSPQRHLTGILWIDHTDLAAINAAPSHKGRGLSSSV